MRRSHWMFLVATTTVVSLHSAEAQIARTRGTPPPERQLIGANPRFPFVGSWAGRMALRLDTLVLAMDFDVVGDQYTGKTVHPDGGQVPHRNTRLVDGALLWEIKNSGAGTWVYAARRVVGDTLFGTVALRDGPGRDGNPESGTFVLVRQRR
jgi:hypothetical protein